MLLSCLKTEDLPSYYTSTMYVPSYASTPSFPTEKDGMTEMNNLPHGMISSSSSSSSLASTASSGNSTLLSSSSSSYYPSSSMDMYNDTNEQQVYYTIQQLGTSHIKANNNMKSSLYKTELCKRYMQYGNCRYGIKCQFAHGVNELRQVLRHPKYKTTRCKSFWGTGQCPYGIRCRFIHEEATTDYYYHHSMHDLPSLVSPENEYLMKEHKDCSITERSTSSEGGEEFHYDSLLFSEQSPSSPSSTTMLSPSLSSYLGDEETHTSPKLDFKLWKMDSEEAEKYVKPFNTPPPPILTEEHDQLLNHLSLLNLENHEISLYTEDNVEEVEETEMMEENNPIVSCLFQNENEALDEITEEKQQISRLRIFQRLTNSNL